VTGPTPIGITFASYLYWDSAWTAGADAVRIGSGAGLTSKTAAGAIAIGKNTASAVSQGVNSIAIGTNAGNAIALSEGTIAIGVGAGPTVTHGTNHTYIGAGANGSGITGFVPATNKQIVLGDTTTDVYIGRNAFAQGFRIWSDYRIKQNVTNLGNTYVLDKLRPVSYYNTKSQSEDIGFIAHEVQKEIPSIVSGEKDGEQLQSINYNAIIPLLVKELNEQKQQNKENAEKIIDLVKSNEYLFKEVNEHKQIIKTLQNALER
jgi:predicted metallopeptidase